MRAKRAGALPPIWRDDRVPDLSAVLTPGLQIDPAEFADWLAPLLAEYRSEAAIREALPARADELATAAALADALEAAAAALRPGAIPERLEALLADEGHGAELNWFEFRRRLADDLALARILTRRAASRIPPARTGRKSERGRDRLLAAVVERLRAAGLPEKAARPIAFEILRPCRVTLPTNADAVKRAARKGQK